MSRLRAGSRGLMRDINRNLVLNLIRAEGPISRTDIGARTGLSLAAISGIVGGLLEAGLVRETGEGESSGGRRPVLLRLNEQAGFVVGVKLMEHAVTSALTDLHAQVLYHRITPFAPPAGPESLQAALTAIIHAVERTIEESKVVRGQVLGVGVGMAGLVDGKEGICRYSPFFGWHDAKISEPIADHLALPVYLENDVNTLTVAEQWFGYGHGKDHFAVVTVGRGIGAGLVVNGRFCRGALGGAGELGHITVQEGGPLCNCGKRGCLEALAADPAVIREAEAALARGEPSSLLREGLTLAVLVEAADAGDGLAQRVLADSGRWFGLGVAALVNILNPELVIVGGEGVCAGEWRLAPMREAIRHHAYAGLAESLEIVVESCGDEAWARGAACVVLGEMFTSPVHKAGEDSAVA